MNFSRKSEQIAPSITLEITSKAKQMKKDGEDIIILGAGEPDFNTPENIRNAAIKAINEGFTKYTQASGIEELKTAIANKFKRDNNLTYSNSQIMISTGAKQCIWNVFAAILNSGDEVIMPKPYWVSYPELIKLADGIHVFAFGDEENNFKYTKSALESVVTTKTKAIFVNPGGLEFEETLIYAQEVQKYVNCIDVSRGNVFNEAGVMWLCPSYLQPHMINVEYSRRIKEVVSIPVSVVGNIYTIEEAEQILAEGKADIVGMCRSFMAGSNMIENAIRGEEYKTRPCIRCMDGCGAIYHGMPLRCSVNPKIGREHRYLEADTSVIALGLKADNSLYKEIAAEMPLDTFITGDCDTPKNIMNTTFSAFNIAVEI